MTHQSIGTIVFVAGDVGPARYLLALRQYLTKRLLWCGSSLTNPIFKSEGCMLADLDYALAEADVVVTGTCLGEGIDKLATRLARDSGLTVISIVEHWSWFQERFRGVAEVHMPDMLLVNDLTSAESAIKAGLAPSSLRVVGNPVLENLARTSKKRVSTTRSSAGQRTIVFVSESLAEDKQSTRLPNITVTEYDVLNAILVGRRASDKVVVKLHPTEHSSKFHYLDNEIEVLADASVEEIAEIADVVVGLGSMLLLELAALGCSVISVDHISNVSFVGERIGATHSASSMQELGMLIDSPPIPDISFACRFNGSGSRIAELISMATLK
jgi:hypothetical protein